jgi:hypothetical protein
MFYNVYNVLNYNFFIILQFFKKISLRKYACRFAWAHYHQCFSVLHHTGHGQTTRTIRREKKIAASLFASAYYERHLRSPPMSEELALKARYK